MAAFSSNLHQATVALPVATIHALNVEDDSEEEWPPEFIENRTPSPIHKNHRSFSLLGPGNRAAELRNRSGLLGDRIFMNISGAHFEAWRSSLSRYGSSWLARLGPESPHYNAVTNEFDYPRSAAIFPCILAYLSTGELHRPNHVCKQEFLDDITYFGIHQSAVSPCCRVGSAAGTRKKSERSKLVRQRWQKCARIVLKSLRRESLDSMKLAVALDFRKIEGWVLFKSRVWRMSNLTIPRLWGITDAGGWPKNHPFHRMSVLLSNFYMAFSMSFVLLSISAFIASSEPQFRTCFECDSAQPIFINGSCTLVTYALYPRFLPAAPIVCVAWFTAELLSRLACCPNRRLFMKDPLTWIDIAAVLPFYCTVGLSAKQLLGQAIAISLSELSLLFFLLAMGVIVFASAVYYAEQSNPTTLFVSIPDGFWWAIVTMTTVGYGDYYPLTTGGRFVGGLAALCGIIVLALPVPFFVNNFTRLYQENLDRVAKHKENERQGLKLLKDAAAKAMAQKKVRIQVAEEPADGGPATPAPPAAAAAPAAIVPQAPPEDLLKLWLGHNFVKKGNAVPLVEESNV